MQLKNMLHRTDPGPGGFYDNFGTPSAWKRVRAKKTWAEDPGSLESPRVSFGVGLTGVDWVHEVVAKGFRRTNNSSGLDESDQYICMIPLLR